MKTQFTAERLLEQRGEATGVWKRQVALILVCLAIFMDALDTSIVNIALPNIQRDLHMTITDLPWVQGAYLLTYAGLLLLGGVLPTCLVDAASFSSEPRSSAWPPSPAGWQTAICLSFSRGGCRASERH